MNRKIILYIVILFLLSAVFYLWIFPRVRDYRNYALAWINKNPYFDLHADEIGFGFFPGFSVLLKGVKAEYKKSASRFTIIECETLIAGISVRSLLKDNISFKSLEFENGSIHLHGSLFIKDTFSAKGFSAHDFSVEEISLNNIKINYYYPSGRVRDAVLVRTLSARKGVFNGYIIQSQGEYQGGNIGLDCRLDNLNMKNPYPRKMDIDVGIELTNFRLSRIGKYTSIIDFGSIGEPLLTGAARFTQTSGEQVSIELKDIRLDNLKLGNNSILNRIELNAEALLSASPKTLSLNRLEITCKDIIDAEIKGIFRISETGLYPEIIIDADDLYIKPLYEAAKAIGRLHKNNGENKETIKVITSDVNILSKKIVYNNYEFTDVKTNIKHKDNAVSIEIINAGIFDGQLDGRSVITLDAQRKYQFDIKLFRIDTAELLSKITHDKYFTGRANSSVTLESEGNTPDEFVRNLDADVNITSDNIVFKDVEFNDAEADIKYKNSVISIFVPAAGVFEGEMEGRSEITLNAQREYKLNFSFFNVNSEELLSKFTDDKYMTGTASSSVNIACRGNTMDDFLKNLKADGGITVRQGELFGYANILKPLFSLGKLVNILGPKGKKTEFDTLGINFEINKEKINIESLNMKGVGLDAKGSGNIGFDRKTDMRITIGLGGIAGKIIRVPVLYRGKIGETWAFVDPVWLGSVYAGMTLIPGPPGAVIGPTVTETIRDLFNDIRNRFRPSGEKE